MTASGIYSFASITLGRQFIPLHYDLPEGVTDPSLGLAFIRGAFGGWVTGALTGPFLLDYEDEDDMARYYLAPNQLAKKLFPIVPMILPFMADIIGDAISSHINCFTHNDHHYCLDNSTFVTRAASVSIVGDAILTPCLTLAGYLGYKLYKWHYRHDDANEPVAAAPLPQPRILDLQQRLENCYDGAIPAIFLDPVHQTLMNNPVMLRCGHNYDEEHLAELKTHCTECSLCRAPFNEEDFINPAINIALKGQIIEFVEQQERAAETVVLHITTQQDDDEKNAMSTPDREYELKSPASHSLFYRAPSPCREQADPENIDTPYLRLHA
jgi:hypothetical protein